MKHTQTLITNHEWLKETHGFIGREGWELRDHTQTV